jgi:hypothetical protein
MDNRVIAIASANDAEFHVEIDGLSEGERRYNAEQARASLALSGMLAAPEYIAMVEKVIIGTMTEAEMRQWALDMINAGNGHKVCYRAPGFEDDPYYNPDARHS